jgi:predicted anti-sigma-YlaC factor YlaD
VVDCQGFQLLISARLDGETNDLEDAALSEHLAKCSACREFEGEAGSLVARLTIKEAPLVPDQTARILQTYHRPRVSFRYDLLRVLVGTLGLIRITAAIGLFSAGFSGVTGGHVGTELAAAEMAIGVGLVFASVRPARSGALAVVLAVLAVATVFGAVMDASAGRVGWVDELAHFVDALAAISLWRLSTRTGSGHRRTPATA